MTQPGPALKNLLEVRRNVKIDEYINRITEALMPKRPAHHGRPYQGPTGLDFLTGELHVEVRTITDGTVTEVFLVDDIGSGPRASTHLGRGVSRRRKGDPRNPQRGYEIALARALHDMADGIMAEAG